jgi:uncharacterized protein YcbK (DUF882 family)
MNIARFMTRRDLIIGGLAGCAGLTGASRNAAAHVPGTQELSFYHLHTTERLRIAYRDSGLLVEGALREINRFLRDFRNGREHAIDVDLLDTLSLLYERFGRRGSFEVISGYRSPRTNEALRKGTTGVAKNSWHLSGRAIDVRLTSADTVRLRDAALALRRGGVGFYPESNFVHLDTGPVRSW